VKEEARVIWFSQGQSYKHLLVVCEHLISISLMVLPFSHQEKGQLSSVISPKPPLHPSSFILVSYLSFLLLLTEESKEVETWSDMRYDLTQQMVSNL
jgi:hypothetical protein